jgi:hypothetical protein
LKSSELNNFQALITTPPTMRLLSIFDAYSPGTSNGGNGTYQIIAFVPVYVVYAQGTGQGNMDIAVVPAPSAVTDPTVSYTNVVPLTSTTNPSPYVVPILGKISQ